MSRVKLPKRGRLVIVKWDDAKGDARWHERGDALTVCANETVGWLTGKSQTQIVVSSSRSDGGVPWGMRTAIPRGDVTDCRNLRIGKRP